MNLLTEQKPTTIVFRRLVVVAQAGMYVALQCFENIIIVIIWPFYTILVRSLLYKNTEVFCIDNRYPNNT